MPSPTEITLPISLTSTPPRYSSICSRMILLISSALISMTFLGFSNQAVLECLQLCADRTVVDRAADLGHHATDQQCIDSDFHSDHLARSLHEFRCQFVLLRCIER